METKPSTATAATTIVVDEEEEEEEEDAAEAWGDWESGAEEDGGDSSPNFLCLFCGSRFDSTASLFKHCSVDHAFDFYGVVRDMGLDFYGSIKLINYVRSQVAENKCWSCGETFQCREDVQNHLHVANSYNKGGKVLWADDSYLKPFMEDDSLLHSIAVDDDDEDWNPSMDKEELMRQLMSNEELEELCRNTHNMVGVKDEREIEEKEDQFEKITVNGSVLEDTCEPLNQKDNEKQLKISRATLAAREIKNVNDGYFGAYGSFGIHREMLSDKVRTDAYRSALINNPSLLNQATVLDVGCGTGILSLFAAQAGASRVIAVEASAKMATVATQIAKDNGLLADESLKCEDKKGSKVISVVHCMVEELDKHIQVPPRGIDVLVSEWMGYCLLYESMLSSVLYARDHFLKPGGAILPDTATIFGAGFGRGGTSLPFWDNVYGFDMSCIGKEIAEDAARVPMVDIVEPQDIVTESAMLHYFDLATMTQEEMDFTSSFELKPRPDNARLTWCYGIVLWFETGFTARYCKEAQAILSTSPHCPKTHWSQTIFTFKEPIALTTVESIDDSSAPVGSRECPASTIRSRISIVRSSAHRSIDASIETTAVGSDGRKRSWPAQIFNL
ncbi:putative protein arginine N-methyltransferase 3 [Ananas comosus]|uniref:C2H2-type domain-containing protein n=1 Tax=Ananas comosus TaxID=4615 RepID=A0A199VL40_ANACO|nr:putative protein arginine N-methyltransferase 3 [Ananas comosus]